MMQKVVDARQAKFLLEELGLGGSDAFYIHQVYVAGIAHAGRPSDYLYINVYGNHGMVGQRPMQLYSSPWASMSAGS